jgi:hypothetical protein
MRGRIEYLVPRAIKSFEIRWYIVSCFNEGSYGYEDDRRKVVPENGEDSDCRSDPSAITVPPPDWRTKKENEPHPPGFEYAPASPFFPRLPPLLQEKSAHGALHRTAERICEERKQDQRTSRVGSLSSPKPLREV